MPSAQQAPTEQQAAAPPPASDLSIAEMSRMLDVAAALRRERLVAEQQLNHDQTRAMLRERLLEAARVSGDPVSEQEIDAAIEAYFANLHEFQAPKPGFETFLAHLYVLRGPIAKWAAGIVAACLVWWGFSSSGLLPGEARDRMLLEELHAKITRSAAAAREVAASPETQARFTDYQAQADAYREASDLAELKSLAEIIAREEAVLKQEYTLRVVQRPVSAQERLFEDASGQRVSGTYLIVEAIDPSGRPVSLPIRDAETGETTTIGRWGEEVPKEVFERVVADKQADGVLDETEFAVKRRGELTPRVQMPGANGAPLTRGRQFAP